VTIESVKAPTIDELIVADAPEAWREVGFDVEGDLLEVGGVRIRLGGPDTGRGIVGCSVRGLLAEMPDGLPLSRSKREDMPPARTQPHPNTTIALDHLVAFSADLDRTIAALERAGLELRRLRTEPTPAGAPRQGFFRLGEVILEVIDRPPRSREERDPKAAARFWGFAFSVADLDRCATVLGDRLGEARDAVQPGRRIATLRREAGLAAAVAFMTPSPSGGRPPKT
jgi:hypothetical protein